MDEIWQYVYAKAKNVPEKERGTFGYGDVWTWVVLDADSKLILSWRVGPRDAATAYELMMDLAGRLATRVQLTTDGHRAFSTRSKMPGDNLDVLRLHVGRSHSTT